MNIYEIKTEKSDYPFIVIAENFNKAFELLSTRNIYDSSVNSVKRLENYNSDNILIEERIISREEIKKEVYSEVQNEMPHWNKMTNGAIGGGDRDCFLIRTSKGYYFTSQSVGPNEVYLDLDELENLSKPEGVE